MNELELLVAREKISRQLYLYCKSIDQSDWESLRSCFGDEHIHHHGTFSGSADEFVLFAKNTLNKYSVTQHIISNLIVDIDESGLSASSEAYFNATHFIKAENIHRTRFDKGGQPHDTDWIVAGVYEDRWVLRAGRWLIVQRNARHLWDRVQLSSR